MLRQKYQKLLASRDAADHSKVKLVSAVRMNRNDGKAKSFASKYQSRATISLKDNARDSGCGFKLIEQAFLELPVFDSHRFLPALIKRKRLCHGRVPVTNRPR